MSIELMNVEVILRNRIAMLEKTMLAYDRRMDTRAVDEDRKRMMALENALFDVLSIVEKSEPGKAVEIRSLLAKKIYPYV